MKRLLVAALLSAALLSATDASARAGGAGFGIGVGLNLNFSAGCNKGGGCQPAPGWSGSYPQPMPYGGYQAWNPYQQQAPGCAYGYGGYNGYPQQGGYNAFAQQGGYNAFAQQGGFGGYDQSQAWMQQAPVQTPAQPQATTAGTKPAPEAIKAPGSAASE